MLKFFIPARCSLVQCENSPQKKGAAEDRSGWCMCACVCMRWCRVRNLNLELPRKIEEYYDYKLVYLFLFRVKCLNNRNKCEHLTESPGWDVTVGVRSHTIMLFLNKPQAHQKKRENKRGSKINSHFSFLQPHSANLLLEHLHDLGIAANSSLEEGSTFLTKCSTFPKENKFLVSSEERESHGWMANASFFLFQITFHLPFSSQYYQK